MALSQSFDQDPYHHFVILDAHFVGYWGGGGQIRRRGYLSVTDDVKILHGVKGISPP